VLSQTNASDSLIVGESGGGMLTISGSGQVTTAGTITLGMSGGSGTINLNGGALITPQIQRGTGTGKFNFNGGTLKAAASSATFMQGLTSASVMSSGAFINDAGFGITIAQPLLSGVSNDGGLTKMGAGTLTLTAAETYVGATKVNFGALTLATGASLTSTSVTVAAGATLNVNGSLSTTTTLISNGATTFAANAGSGISDLTLASATIGSAGTVTIAAPNTHASRTLLLTGSLSFASGPAGKLDLTGNDMVIHNGNVANISTQIASGYDGGGWNGNGVLSSISAGGVTALGYELNSSAGSTLFSTFDGQAVTSTDVLVKYTYAGDANLDGVVNGSDYTLIDNGLNNSLTGWRNGDFNYDGVVNGDDYTLIDNAFNIQGASLAAEASEMVASNTSQIASSSVSGGTAELPEPASLGVLAVGLLARRRRR
jgi:MYXO-CTERM domain-containing protein